MKEFHHSSELIRPDGQISRSIDEMNPAFRSVMKRLVEQCGETLVSFSTKQGHSRAWMPRLIQGERQFNEANLHKVAQGLEMSLEQLFTEYLVAVESPHPAIKSDLLENPARLLVALRGKNDPDLGWVKRFADIPVTTLPKSARFELHPNVRRIDDLREFDRQAALVEAETWLRSLERRGEQRRLSAAETSHLCSALGVWSSIQRVLGRQALGAKTLELAWRLHGHAPLAPSRGDLLERTAAAALDYGFPAAGLPLINTSLVIAVLWRDTHREAKAWLALGTFAFHCGLEDVAESALDRVLEHSAADSLRLAGAASFLALLFKNRGQLTQAREVLDRATSSIPDLPQQAQLLHRGCLAEILKELGEFEMAKEIFEGLLTPARIHLKPLDCLVLILFFFEVLVEVGRADQLTEHSAYLASLLPELESSPLAEEILKELLSLIRCGQDLDLNTLQGMREQLED